MKRAFIRALWGVYSKDPSSADVINSLSQKHSLKKIHGFLSRRNKIDRDMFKTFRNGFSEPFIVYAFGQNNFDKAKAYKFDVKLIDKNPAPFSLVTEIYRNKLEILKYAMEVDGYDEIVFLDWDCKPQKKLPVDFWDIMGKKETIQANLMTYCRVKCRWRKEDRRKVPNGGFLYIRDKSIPAKAIKYWGTLRDKDNDEPAYALLTDAMMGGWKGVDTYWKLFEPEFCNLIKCSSYPIDLLHQKNQCFIHSIQVPS